MADGETIERSGDANAQAVKVGAPCGERVDIFVVGHSRPSAAFTDEAEARAFAANLNDGSLGFWPLSVLGGRGRAWRLIWSCSIWQGDGTIAAESGPPADPCWAFDVPDRDAPAPDHQVDHCNDARLARVTAWSYQSAADARQRAERVLERLRAEYNRTR